jgi:UDP-glucose 4-epimerase
MPGMNVLVTGGAGYVGSVIAARLLASGHDVTVFDDLSRGHRAAVPPGARLVIGDVRDEAAVLAALTSSGSDGMVHMAALAEVAESIAKPELYRDVNSGGAASVARAALRADVRRLVFSSTAAVYGEPDEVPIPESATLRASSPYGQSKLDAERVLAEAVARSHGHLGVVVLRYFNACGADGERGEDHDPESHLVPLAVRAARDGAELQVFGDDYATPDGTCVRDYVHVVDLAAAHIASLEGLPATAGTYNLGTGRGDSVLQVLDAVRRASGLPLRRRVAPRRAGDPARLVASNELAGSRLRWRPEHTLDDAVTDAWEWMCAHPAGYAERRP